MTTAQGRTPVHSRNWRLSGEVLLMNNCFYKALVNPSGLCFAASLMVADSFTFGAASRCVFELKINEVKSPTSCSC